MLKNHSARIYLSANLVLMVAVGVGNTMLIHVNNFFYGFSSQQTGVFMPRIFLCLLPAAIVSKYFVRRFGKERGIIRLLCCMAVIGQIPITLHLYGFTPPPGSTGLLAVVCVFIVLHQSLYIAHLNIAGGMVPDIADELAHTSGMRQEGIINSGMMLAQKMTFGLGAFFAGIAIDFAGLDGITDASQVTGTMMERLAWVYGPGLMCMTFLVALIYSRYTLTRSRVEDIQRHLPRAGHQGHSE